MNLNNAVQGTNVTGRLAMTLDEYSQRALAFANVRDVAYNLRHGAIGVFTEVGELCDAYKRQVIYGKPVDLPNLREEVGDVMWYANLLCATLGMRFQNDLTDARDRQSFFSTCALLGLTAGNILAMVDNITTDERRAELSFDLPYAVESLIHSTAALAEQFGFTLEECAYYNIAKLDVRYKGGFSAESALNRDLDAEKAALAA